MEAEKKYKVARDAEAALTSNGTWDSYIDAEEVANKINDDTGAGVAVYKVVTTVDYADRVTEDYWEYR